MHVHIYILYVWVRRVLRLECWDSVLTHRHTYTDTHTHTSPCILNNAPFFLSLSFSASFPLPHSIGHMPADPSHGVFWKQKKGKGKNHHTLTDHTCVCACVHVHVYMCAYVHVYMRACVYIHTWVCLPISHLRIATPLPRCSFRMFRWGGYD